jgi:hypothetical protein
LSCYIVQLSNPGQSSQSDIVLSSPRPVSSSSQNQDERNYQRRCNRIKNRVLTAPYIQTHGGDNHGDTKSQKQSRDKHGGTKSQKQSCWEVTGSPANTVATNAEAFRVLASLCQGAASNLEDSSSQEWIQSMKALVEGQRWIDENGAFVVNSLKSLVARCKQSLEMAAGVKFVTMINMLQLAAKTDRWVFILSLPTVINKINLFSLKRLHNMSSVDDIYRRFLNMSGAPKMSTFCKWVGHGTKFATCAGAGECHWLFNFNHH